MKVARLSALRTGHRNPQEMFLVPNSPETCRGPQFVLKCRKIESRWFHCSDILVNKTFTLTLSLLMYICGAPCKARNFNVVYIWTYVWQRCKAVSFYLRHVSTLNQCRKFSCGTVVCKHFASYQGHPNYRWDLIRYAKG
jgi:hypothetical protein